MLKNNYLVQTPLGEELKIFDSFITECSLALNKKKEDNNNLIDENTLMFVALHEMAHVASKSIGHNTEFWDNFQFLIEEAESFQLYTPIDYSKKNAEYCGMTITSSPYFT